MKHILYFYFDYHLFCFLLELIGTTETEHLVEIELMQGDFRKQKIVL